MGWFRLKFDTDVVGLTALFLSIGGLIYQGFLAYKAPDILQFPPDQILFYPEENNGVKYLQIGAQSTYINKGKGDRNAVLKMERILFDLGGRTYELKWQNFLKYRSEGTELKKEDVQPALPAVMKSGEGASHETRFAPKSFQVSNATDPERYKNFLPWEKFVSEMERVNELDLRIIGEFYGLEEKQTRVYVDITDAVKRAFKTKGWAAPAAWPRESKTAQSIRPSPTPLRNSTPQFLPPRVQTPLPSPEAEPKL